MTFINTDPDWPRLEATHEDIILISAFPAFTSEGYKNPKETVNSYYISKGYIL